VAGGGGEEGEEGRAVSGVLVPPTEDPLKTEAEPQPKKKGRRSRAEIRAQQARDEEAERVREAAELARLKKEREEQAAELAPVLAEIVAWPFDVVANRRGEYWRLEDDEKTKLALALSRVSCKYVPTFLARFEEEVALVIAAFTVVSVRVRKDIAENARKSPALARPHGVREDAAPEESSS
jgi:hypothetical protein